MLTSKYVLLASKPCYLLMILLQNKEIDLVTPLTFSYFKPPGSINTVFTISHVHGANDNSYVSLLLLALSVYQSFQISNLSFDFI